VKLPLGVQLGNVLHEESHGAGAGQDSVHDPTLDSVHDPTLDSVHDPTLDSVHDPTLDSVHDLAFLMARDCHNLAHKSVSNFLSCDARVDCIE